ncbi:MAG: hypothetical protein MZV63_25635 [Marinilabiliales bacterium]|nr:hypothetical protein [Marinilabiliales bacterium]
MTGIAYEKDGCSTEKSSPKHKEYEAMYDETLSTVAVDEVVDGTVIPDELTVKWLSTSVTNRKA